MLHSPTCFTTPEPQNQTMMNFSSFFSTGKPVRELKKRGQVGGDPPPLRLHQNLRHSARDGRWEGMGLPEDWGFYHEPWTNKGHETNNELLGEFISCWCRSQQMGWWWWWWRWFPMIHHIFFQVENTRLSLTAETLHICAVTAVGNAQPGLVEGPASERGEWSPVPGSGDVAMHGTSWNR